MELTRKEMALFSINLYNWQKNNGRMVMFDPKSYAIACIKNQPYF